MHEAATPAEAPPGTEGTATSGPRFASGSDPAATIDLSDTPDPPLAVGTTLERFEVRGLLGEGGMGRVYRAYDPQLDREVALKVLRHAGSDHGEARLMREAQAMARLNHPNLLPIFDVGQHAGGLFIAMELVQGQTLTQWLRAGPHSLDAVLPVLVMAGRGLQAAHEAGLVHRDFKPSNVMIGQDGRVRVMDFGLARLSGDGGSSPSASVSSPGSLDASLTRSGTVAGSPPYMAPEQHQGAATDARADQYAFCVALWEAVFGSRPFVGSTYEKLYLAKLGPPPPIPEQPATPRWLQHVVQRGLALDPADRFPSMEALLARLKPPATSRRRRGMQLLGLAALASAAAYGLSMSSSEPLCQGARAKMEGIWDDHTRRRVHDAVLATEVPHAEETWQRLHPVLDEYAAGWIDGYDEACAATQVRGEQPERAMDVRMRCLDGHRRRLGSLVQTLETGNTKALDRSIQAAGNLPALARCYTAELAEREAPVPDDPHTRARVEALRDELAEASALEMAGDFDGAMGVAQRVRDEAAALEFEPLTAEAHLRLGTLHDSTGQYEEASKLLSRAYFGAEQQPRIQARTALQLLHVWGIQRQDHEQAETWAKHAEAAVKRVGDEQLRSDLLSGIASLRHVQGRHDEALELLHQGLAIRERLHGPDHFDVALSLNNIGIIEHARGNYDRALESFLRAMAIQEKALGPRHPRVARLIGNVGAAHEAVGRYDEALGYYRRSLELQRTLLGPDHPIVALLLNNIGIVYDSQGKWEPALEHYRQALDIRERVLGDRHPDTATSIDSVAGILQEQGEVEAAIEHQRRALAIREEALGADHPNTAISLNNLGTTLQQQGEHEEALKLHHRALAIRREAYGPRHPRVASSLNNLGRVYRDQGQHDEALHSFRQAIEIWEAKLEPGHSDLLAGLLNEGELLLEMGRPEAALEPLQRVVSAREDDQGARRAKPRFALARALAETGEGDRARQLATQARADYLADEGHGDDVERIDAWLAARGS